MEKRLDVKPTEDQKNCAALAIGYGVFIGVALMVFISSGDGGTQFLKMYCCITATFLVVLALYHTFYKISSANPRFQSACFSKKAVNFYAFGTLAVLLYSIVVLLIFGGMARVSGNGGRIAFLFLTVLLTVLCMNTIKKYIVSGGKSLFMITCAFSYIVMFLYAYVPNLFNQSEYVVHHYSAVTGTIYNVAYNLPYTLFTSGVYGHYAILLWPLVKLFGHTPQAIAIYIAVLNCIVLTLMIALTLKVTKNNFLRSTLILASISWNANETAYVAVWPLRTLWPLLILVYVIYGYERIKNKKLFAILGYILCSLAITWQTDSGFAAAAAYTIYLWLFMWKTEAVFSAKAFRVYVMSIFGLVCSVFGMVVLVNLYNILCGGPLVFLSCFYPLILSEGYVEALQTDMQLYWSWLVPICIFIVSVAVGLLSSSFLKVSNDSRKINLALYGVMGIGQSYYFFNRSVAGWACVTFYFLVCVAYLVEDGFTSKVKRDCAYSILRHIISVGSVAYLCIYFLNFIVNVPGFLYTKLDTDVNTMDSMSEISEAVAAIPKDTYVVGKYTWDMYAYMGWDPGSQLKRGDSETWLEGLRQSASLLVSGDLYLGTWAKQNFEDMAPILSIPVESPLFYYLVKVKNKVKLMEERDFSLTDVGDHQIAAFPITIKKNTPYKIELTLADNVDFSTAAKLVVDFHDGPAYDREEQEINNFVQNGRYEYMFCFNSGEFDTGGEVLDCAARVFVWNTDTVIQVKSFSVTEMEATTPEERGEMKNKATLVEERDFSLIDVGGYQIASFPFAIQEDTPYKVELTLADDVDFSTAANLIVDFYAEPAYDRKAQERSSFVQNGTYQYTFYINSGKLGGDMSDCQARVFVWNTDTVIRVESFSVTEMENLLIKD